jgi:hypothetical protein
LHESKTVAEFLNEDYIARCGINCLFCPSYKDHIKSDEDKQQCSDIWYKYLGFRVPPETIQPCPGCEQSVYYGATGADGEDCAIRKCAVSMDARTCAHCSMYQTGCTKHHGADPGSENSEQHSIEASTEAEDFFFGNLGHKLGNRSPEAYLAEIRASLKPEDIVDGSSSME